MPVTATVSNHYKFSLMRGDLNFTAKTSSVSITFNETAGVYTIERAADSFITDGFRVGHVIKTTSATANRQGPFVVISIAALSMTVKQYDGTAPTFTDGVETVSIVGSYIKALLMRSGFVFNKDNHAMLKNIKADTTAAQTISVTAATKKFDWPGGTFVTKGFVAGNKITVSGLVAANGTYTIDVVNSETQITVLEAIGGGADVAGTGDERIIANDELATGSGYTQDAKWSGIVTVTEDDTNDYANGTVANIVWTASGGDIGPTPGVIFYDDTSPDDTVIGYLDFGGEQTATDGNPFTIASGVFRVA